MNYFLLSWALTVDIFQQLFVIKTLRYVAEVKFKK